MRFDVRAAPPTHYEWICRRTGYVPTPVFKAIEAVDSNGYVRGMVGYDLFTENSAQMSIAVTAPIAVRALLRPSFEYVFEQLDKKVALAIVSSENQEALSLDFRLGFREVYRVKDGKSDGVDLLLLEMRRDECRWLRKRTHNAQ